MLDVQKALSTTPWLPALEATGRTLLTASARLLSFRPGRRILRAGERAREVFVLLQGTVRLGAPVVERGSTLVALRGPNALLGAAEALSDEVSKSDVVTLEATTLAGIPVEVFLKLVGSEGRFALEAGKELARLSQELQGQAELLAPLPVTLRLRQLLLRYAQACGTSGEDGIQLRTKLTQASLAVDLGVERKSVLRAMDQLRALGLLDKRNARYHLPKPAELAKWMPEEGTHALPLPESDTSEEVGDVEAATLRTDH